MKTPEQRKQASIAILQEHGVPYIDWLPVIEDASEARVRSAEEIARRAIACLITIQAASTATTTSTPRPLPTNTNTYWHATNSTMP